MQRFLDATIEGWYSYLYADPAPASLIKADNPEITDARWTEFFKTMAQQGLCKPDLDVSKAYTLRFVGKATGISMRPK